MQKNLQDKLKHKGLKLPLYPPPHLIEKARTLMGSIDFDPTSDPVQQVLVDATSVPTLGTNPLKEHWSGNVWLSPDGGVRDVRTWFEKTVAEYRTGHIDSFVFFTGASEVLRAVPLVWDYPICIPFKRVKMLRAKAHGFEEISPSSWNLLIYGPPVDQVLSDIDKVSMFHQLFSDLGRVIVNEYAGDNWNRDLEFLSTRSGTN